MEPNNLSAGSAPAAPPVKIDLVRMSTSGNLSVTCYEHAVPPFVEAELERLYGSMFSSLARFRVFGGAENASTCVVRTEAGITDIWLFRREQRAIRIINEGIAVDAESIRRLAGYIFAAYASVDVISFHAVEARFQSLAYPHQRYHCLEDIVVRLPLTVDEYLASLGKATRNYIERYLKALQRSFPSYRYRAYAREEIDESLVREIVRLNRRRMAHKGKISSIDDEETRRLARLARECGLIGTVTIGGRLCAGTVNYTIGRNCFLEVVAHDPVYNDFRLGTLCCYLTVCECIRRGNDEYHFLWGRSEYKYRLRGVARNLDDLAVYRSRASVLLSAGTAVRMIAAARIHGFRFWLLDKARRKDGLTSRLAAHVLNSLRGVRHYASGSLARLK